MSGDILVLFVALALYGVLAAWVWWTTREQICRSCGQVYLCSRDGRLIEHLDPATMSDTPGPSLCHQQGPMAYRAEPVQ